MTEFNITAVDSKSKEKSLFEMNKKAIEKGYLFTFPLHKGIFIAFFIIGIAFCMLGFSNLLLIHQIIGFFHLFVGFTYILISVSYLRIRLWLTKKGLYFKYVGIKGFIPYQNIKNVKVSYEKWKIRNFFREYIVITGRFSFDSLRRLVKIELNEPQEFYNLLFKTRKKSVILIELPIPEQLAGLIHYGVLLNGYTINKDIITPGIEINVWPIQDGSYEERSEYLPQFD